MVGSLWTSLKDALSVGLLPKWLLLVGITSIGNSIQAFTSLYATRRIYSSSPTSVTPLSARTFGTWTFLAAIVRLYALFDLSNPALYQLAFATFAVAWVHFVCEWLVFGTAKVSTPFLMPCAVASGSLVWMWVVWGDYVR